MSADGVMVATSVTSSSYAYEVMSPGSVSLSGTGNFSSLAVNPAGKLHFTFGGSPLSPGLIQYKCHFGAILKLTPTLNGLPGSTLATSAISFICTSSSPDCARAIAQSANKTNIVAMDRKPIGMLYSFNAQQAIFVTRKREISPDLTRQL